MPQPNSTPIRLLKEWVEIPSGTANVGGVQEVQKRVRQRLDRLGFQTQLISNPLGASKSGSLLVGEMAGMAPSTSPTAARGRGYITLVAHADTVFEASSGFSGFELSADGTHAVGPGTIDDKGGIVVALQGLEKFLSEQKPLWPLRFICTPSEETGSPGFTELLSKYSQDSVMVLGFEPSMEDGSIIESRRGNRWYQLRVTGRESHAGREFSSGVNAAHELIHMLEKLQRLTDLSRDVTVSVAQLLGGGDKFNIVCGHAEAKIDARFPDFPTRARLHEQFEAILGTPFVESLVDRARAITRYEIADDCPPFSTTRLSQPFLNRYLELASAIEGRQVLAVKSGGASDANYMSREDLIVLDGLGATGGGLHTTREFITLSSLETRAVALYEFLKYAMRTLVT